MTENEPGNREFFEHLIAEFGEQGREAVTFLESADGLISRGEDPRISRRAEAAGYCVREALKRLLPPDSSRPSWRKLSDELLAAKKRFDAVRGLPGADESGALEELLAAITALEDFKTKDQGQHQRRLREFMVSRSGVQPLRFALTEYQRLVREIDDHAVHATPSIEQVRELLGRALSTLRALFAPFPLRRPELDALARLQDPGEEDVERLLGLCSTPHHIGYFMQHAVTPKWLSLLTRHHVVDPPPGGGAWPALPLIERLAPTHGQEIAIWLEEMRARWGEEEISAAYIAEAARHCHPHAEVTLLRALRAFPHSHWVRGQAAQAIEVADANSALIEGIAEVLLDPNDATALFGVADRVIQALIDGFTPDNAEDRILLLARKLARDGEPRYLLFSLMASGSVEDVPEDEARGAGRLLKGILAAVRRARAIGLTTERLLALLDPVPAPLLGRLRAWALREAHDVAPETLVTEVAHALRGRDPTGDDVRLINRITAEFPAAVYVEPWREAMGTPPAIEDAGKALAAGEVTPEWRRIRLWHPLLPAPVHQDWNTVVTVLSPGLPARRSEDYLEPPTKLELEAARSPLSPSELAGLDVHEAARRVSSWRPTNDSMTIARELGRSLEEVVSSEPHQWAARPLDVLALLRHSTYIHHYFEGLTKSSGELSGHGPRLVEAVVFARTHPWEPVPLGDDDFDYDPTWEPVDDAGVRLIGRLAERDVDLGDRHDDAWRVAVTAARDRSSDSNIVAPRDDPLETAINRPCTRALEVVFHLIGAEFRRIEQVRTEAIDLLDEILELEDWNGAEHRAIIAPRLAFLLHVAPAWVETREARLFGSDAPGDLGQKTLELALQWGRPNPWLLERHGRGVRRAIRNGATNALDHALIAMLWEVPGYSIEETVESVVAMGPAVVSNAGERLARLLRQDSDQQHVACGILFWEKVLANDSLPREAFHGYGWWAEVTNLDEETWERLTLATCERAGGSLDWCVEVAERCSRQPMTSDGLAILIHLLHGGHEPWDRSRVAGIGLRALKDSKAEPPLPRDVCNRLRAALMDLGYFEAEDL